MPSKKQEPEAEKKEVVKRVQITPPNIQMAQFVLKGGEPNGGAPLAVNRFSQKAQLAMQEIQKAGGTGRSKRNRKPKDFEELFVDAQYRSREGWPGIHAACIRNAMISACRTVDFKMTLAKLGIFVVADGYDKDDATPLIRIWGPEPEMWIAPARNANGSFDMRARPRWDEWELRPRIRFDADMFTFVDVTNLIMRVGFQVGLGEGRPDSKDSAGIGYGLFRVANENESERAA